MKITVKKGDITKEQTVAIVNAAKQSLEGGGGVDGAIHAAAGPSLLEACKKINYKMDDDGAEYKFDPNGNIIRCDIGEAIITQGFNLSAASVIHTVGPRCVTPGIASVDDKLMLHKCWFNCLVKAIIYNCKTVAFPSISTGIFGFPINEAARVAMSSINLFSITHTLRNNPK